MKRYFFILFCIPIFSLAQKPVQWKLLSKKLDNERYAISLSAAISPSWYLYTVNDSATGIEHPILFWNSESISTNGDPVLSTKPRIINDKMFGKNFKVCYNKAEFAQRILIQSPLPPQLKIVVTAYTSNGTEFLPLSDTLVFTVEGAIAKDLASTVKIKTIDLNNPLSACGDQHRESQRLFATLLLGFLGGLIALFTPCVFPMIPVTVSFFAGKSKNKKEAIKNGLWYGISIFLIYLLASIPFHLLGNIDPQIFNSISTNAWVNVFFFVTFILFALSFFGLFEITLPASVSNLAGSKSKWGSAAGIFFMAVTLAIVSFSCTGPILGSLLVGSLSSSNGAWHLTAGMAGFGLALGLPFALFAMFPQWMQRLPKSGAWMNVIKKSLAFIELALAIKFLSNADLVEHWGLLKREIFIGLWILISLALSLYLLGTFEKKKPFNPSPVLRVASKASHNNASTYTRPRFFFGVLFLLFAFYLAPGVTQSQYANLKLLSGFPPPLSYSIYGKENVLGKGVEPNIINDYQKALELARKQNKPLLVDFTGWACVNCRKMEENVWPDPKIKELIQQKFILVSLYVDDRKKLPAAERFTYKTTDGQEKDINTIGDRYATLQAENFKQVTQPMYAIVSPDEKLINNPVGYTPSINQYKQWLECGIDTYENKKSN